jgi:hypothetical protein
VCNTPNVQQNNDGGKKEEQEKKKLTENIVGLQCS